MHKHPDLESISSPFLKWAGGKSRLLSQLLPLISRGPRLIEPFVGAGSVFLASPFERYVINDANSDLAALWVALRDRPRELTQRAAAYFTKDHLAEGAYLAVRSEFNQASDRFERAVRLVYLNKFGFNGLYRVNRSGRFNVPYGNPASLPRFPREQLESASDKLKRCMILNGGFRAAMDLAVDGDVVYCDPPYLRSATGASFTGYTAEGFGRNQHEALVHAAKSAANRGARVLVSNHDTPETRALYSSFHIEQLTVRRSVSGTSRGRGLAKELVAIL